MTDGIGKLLEQWLEPSKKVFVSQLIFERRYAVLKLGYVQAFVKHDEAVVTVKIGFEQMLRPFVCSLVIAALFEMKQMECLQRETAQNRI